jgi:eukaryotic-like serine/threonine-protein kinase
MSVSPDETEVARESQRQVSNDGDAFAPTLPIGFLIGDKYTVKRVLGAGGDGAVYHCEHTEIGHLVAIKVAHRSRTHNREDIMERFRREARICGSLRHPNVGQVYDVGKLQDGAPYMVMELQEGRSLGAVIDESVLPIGAIIDLTRQLLAGLDAAHRIGIIHRDVKPDNVMLVRDRSGDVVVKLVDFGISKSLDQSRHPGVTAEGIIVGSPDYMPPEQLRGDAVDVRTDVYAVGVLLYETLTRHTPFDAANLPDLVAAILRDPFKPPSQIRFDCPPALEQVVLKAMTRQPEGRYQSVDEFSRALAEVQAATTASRRADPQLGLLATRVTEGAAPRRTHERRTIDNRTLQDIGVQKKAAPRARAPESPPSNARTARMRSARLIAIGLGALGAVFLIARAVWLDDDLANTHVPRLAAPVVPAPGIGSSVAASHPQPTAAGDAPAAAEPDAPAVAVEPEPSSGTSHKAARSAATHKARDTSLRSQPAGERAAVDRSNAALLKQAATAFVLGDAQGAHDAYRKVIARDPKQVDAWRGLGLSSSRLGSSAEAERAFRRYLELRPDAPDSARIRSLRAKLKP